MAWPSVRTWFCVRVSGLPRATDCGPGTASATTDRVAPTKLPTPDTASASTEGMISGVLNTEEFVAMTNPPLEIPVDSGRPEAAASLWAGTTSSLISDRRAATRGDILTVVIEIDDEAQMTNTSGRSRQSGESVSIPQMIGIPQRLNEKLPEGASFDNLAEAESSSTYKGSGNITRRDKLTLRVAATVIDTLPNGTLQIEGTQEVRVNYELRELTVSGFVRPADIDRSNEIAYNSRSPT